MPAFTVRDLAARVSGEVRGDPETVISGIADLAGAQPGHLSFLANPRYLQAARQTAASALLIAADEADEFPAVTIRVASPSFAFSELSALFAPEPVSWAPGVHPTAVVAPDAVLGEGASVQPTRWSRPGPGSAPAP